MAISERDETAILVHNGLHIAGRHVIRMKTPWRGPKAGIEHQPREMKWNGIEKDGAKLKLLADHVPFGEKARKEMEARLRRWLKNHPSGSAIVGDQNADADAMDARVAAPEDAEVDGFGIDLAIVRGCRLVSKKRLGKHGSDHYAVKFVLAVTNKAGKDVEFVVIGWNVKVGSGKDRGQAHIDRVRKGIATMAKNHNPDAFALTETYGMRGHLSGLGYQVTLIVGGKKKPKPKPPAKPVPPKLTTGEKVRRTAAGEIGYHEGRDKNGNWNNDQRYSREVPKLAWSNKQAWCQTFICWIFWHTLGIKVFGNAISGLLPYQPTASCDVAMAAYKKAGRWSEYPAIDAQIFFGVPGDAQHTGFVESYTATTVTTVEGNTNTSGSYQGDGVYRKVHQRKDVRILGYGYPRYPEGIVSADPKWKGRR